MLRRNVRTHCTVFLLKLPGQTSSSRERPSKVTVGCCYVHRSKRTVVAACAIHAPELEEAPSEGHLFGICKHSRHATWEWMMKA